MARSGAKRKAGLREPNGRLKRATTQAELNAISRREQDRMMAVAADNLERRGTREPTSPLAGTALRRFVIAYRLKLELITAGERLLADENRYRMLKGFRLICFKVDAPRQLAPVDMTPGEMRERRRKQDEAYAHVQEAKRAIERAGTFAMGAVDLLCFGNEVPPQDQHTAAQDGLYALAVHYGMVGGR